MLRIQNSSDNSTESDLLEIAGRVACHRCANSRANNRDDVVQQARHDVLQGWRTDRARIRDPKQWAKGVAWNASGRELSNEYENKKRYLRFVDWLGESTDTGDRAELSGDDPGFQRLEEIDEQSFRRAWIVSVLSELGRHEREFIEAEVLGRCHRSNEEWASHWKVTPQRVSQIRKSATGRLHNLATKEGLA